MTYFLERIALHINKNHGSSLDKNLLVFPNIRAGLYFLKYLSANLEKPVWSPAVMTINALFRDLSQYRLAETEQLIFELYKVYKKLNPTAESFDDFFFWGEMLLNDFDDSDKYLTDTEALFATVRDIRNIDEEFGNLTPEQVMIVRQFWKNFEPEKSTSQKKGFLELWKILPQIYREFRSSLIEKNLVYEGIIYRDIAEKFRSGIIPEMKWENIHFIGFNALNTCERILMMSLKNAGKARFYWDYDNSYIDRQTFHSAGFFIKQNLRDFGNDMPEDWNYDTFVSAPPPEIKRRIIETSSDVSQVKLLPELMKDLPGLNGPESHHTAIVLADENLLVPLVSSLPSYVSDINITMGYPLRFSPVYSLVKNLVSLQINSKLQDGEELFDHQDVINLLKHNYISTAPGMNVQDLTAMITRLNRQWITVKDLASPDSMKPILRKIASPIAFNSYLSGILRNLFVSENDKELSNSEKFETSIRNEFIYRVLLAINRLDGIINGLGTEIRPVTYFRLLDKILRTLSVPFSGEPLNGIQIMGILETRTLDFKNIILLSVNEGILPKSSVSSSFIPHNLREAFGLPTIRHQDSIYAYYFYRLLERSENVTFVYNSNSEGLRTGEKSRLLHQMNYLNPGIPEFISSGFIFKPQIKTATTIVKSDEMIRLLTDTFSGKGKRALSPSAVNMWLNCRMKFYYRYVRGLKEPVKIITEIDPALFGDILHDVMKKLYSPYINNILSREILGKTQKDRDLISKVISDSINSKYPSGKQEMTGSDIVISGIISSYAGLIMKYDSQITDLYLQALEKEEYAVIELSSNGQLLQVNTGGKMDRVDSVKGITRIVDYKTGNVSGKIQSISSLFEKDSDKREDAWFQLLMYCEIFHRNHIGTVMPSLYCLRRLADPAYSDSLQIRDTDGSLCDYSQVREEFHSGLISTISSIFEQGEDFEMTTSLRRCEYCPYAKLCQR